MPLLGWPLVLILGVLVGALAIATLLLWPRVRGPVLARTAQQLGMLVAIQVAAIALTAAVANDYGYFYGSWSDLLGSGRSATETSSGSTGTRANGIRPVPVAVKEPWRPQTQWTPLATKATRGLILGTRIRGPRSGVTAPAYVFLPPEYFQPAYARTRFPGVEVFPGYPGNVENLVKRLTYIPDLIRLVQQGQARPMILVLVNPTVAPPRDTECTDVPGGPQTLTFLAEDVPAVVAAHVHARAVDWGAVGDSTGGYCATKLAMVHPSMFSSAVSLSGYYTSLRDGTTGDLWGGSTFYRSLNDLTWRLKHLPAPPVAVLATSGADESGPEGLPNLRAFVKVVHGPMTVTTMVVPGGGHNFTDWNAVIPQGLAWLSVHLWQ